VLSIQKSCFSATHTLRTDFYFPFYVWEVGPAYFVCLGKGISDVCYISSLFFGLLILQRIIKPWFCNKTLFSNCKGGKFSSPASMWIPIVTIFYLWPVLHATYRRFSYNMGEISCFPSLSFSLFYWGNMKIYFFFEREREWHELDKRVGMHVVTSQFPPFMTSASHLSTFCTFKSELWRIQTLSRKTVLTIII